MTTLKQLAQHVRDAFFGDNWTAVNLKDTLEGFTWQEATTKVYSFNTIASLVYHINYYVQPVINAMKNLPLDASDKYSFDHPPINSEDDWQQLVDKVMTDAKNLADEMEQFDENRLFHFLAEEKYGNYYRNLLGLIEHTYYHMGQVVLIKKILREKPTTI